MPISGKWQGATLGANAFTGDQTFADASVFSSTGLNLASASTLGWNADTIFLREAAGRVAMRNGANAQAMRLYNTYTNGSNNEYVDFSWQVLGNTFEINTVGNGTGSSRTVRINIGGQLYDFTSTQFAPGSKVALTASTTSRPGLNMASGVAPTSPSDGDFWYDGTNVKFRVGAVTKTFTLT